MEGTDDGYIETHDDTVYAGFIEHINESAVFVYFDDNRRIGLLDHSKVPRCKNGEKLSDIYEIGDPINVIATHINLTSGCIKTRLDFAG